MIRMRLRSRNNPFRLQD